MKYKQLSICSKSEDETFDFGALLSKLKVNIVCLSGDLGSGKTVLAKGYAKGLNIDEYITSPTFNIINNYKGDHDFYHMDAYRITDEDMLYDIGFEELFEEDSFVVIEWANMIKNSIPKEAIWIEFNKDENNTNNRYLTLFGDSEKIERICEGLI